MTPGCVLGHLSKLPRFSFFPEHTVISRFSKRLFSFLLFVRKEKWKRSFTKLSLSNPSHDFLLLGPGSNLKHNDGSLRLKLLIREMLEMLRLKQRIIGARMGLGFPG